MKRKKSKYIYQIGWLEKDVLDRFSQNLDRLPIPKKAWIGEFDEFNKRYEILKEYR